MARYVLYCAEYIFGIIYCSSQVYPFQSSIMILLLKCELTNEHN